MKFYRIIFSVVFVVVASLSWGQETVKTDTTYLRNGKIDFIDVYEIFNGDTLIKRNDQWGVLLEIEQINYRGDTIVSDKTVYKDKNNNGLVKKHILAKTYPLAKASILDSLKYTYLNNDKIYWSRLSNNKFTITEEITESWYNNKRESDYTKAEKVFLNNNSILFSTKTSNFLKGKLKDTKVIWRDNIYKNTYYPSGNLEKSICNNIKKFYSDSTGIEGIVDENTNQVIFFENGKKSLRRVTLGSFVYHEKYKNGKPFNHQKQIVINDTLYNIDSLKYTYKKIENYTCEYSPNSNTFLFQNSKDTLLLDLNKKFIRRSYITGAQSYNKTTKVDSIYYSNMEITANTMIKNRYNVVKTFSQFRDIHLENKVNLRTETKTSLSDGTLQTVTVRENSKIVTESEYDLNGKLKSFVDNNMNINNTYDDNGDLTSEQQNLEAKMFKKNKLDFHYKIDTISRSFYYFLVRGKSSDEYSYDFDNTIEKKVYEKGRFRHSRIFDQNGIISDSSFIFASVPSIDDLNPPSKWHLHSSIQRLDSVNHQYTEYYKSGTYKKINLSVTVHLQDDFLRQELDENYFHNYYKVKKNGEWTYFHHNGQLAQVIDYKNGNFINDLSIYYHTGQLKAKGQISPLKTHNKKHLPFLNYTNSSINSVFTITIYSLCETETKSERNGLWTFYYPNGKISAIGEYQQGEEVGVWKYFHENGVCILTFDYDNNGLLEIKFMHPNQQIAINGFVKNKRKCGNWTYYYENGILEAKEFYDSVSVSTKWQYYYEDGSIKSDYEFVDGRFQGTILEYNETSELKEKGICVCEKNLDDFKEMTPQYLCKNNTTWNYYKIDGTLQKTEYYDSIGRISKHEYYYDNGQLWIVKNVFSYIIEKYDSLGNMSYKVDPLKKEESFYLKNKTVAINKMDKLNHSIYQSYYTSGSPRTSGQFFVESNIYSSKKPIDDFVTKSKSGKVIRVTKFSDFKDIFLKEDNVKYCEVNFDRIYNHGIMFFFNEGSIDTLYLFRSELECLVTGNWIKRNKKGIIIESGKLSRTANVVSAFEFVDGSWVKHNNKKIKYIDNWLPIYYADKNGTWKYYNNKGNLTKTELWEEGILLKEE